MAKGTFVNYQGYSIWVEDHWVSDPQRQSKYSVAKDIHDSGWIHFVERKNKHETEIKKSEIKAGGTADSNSKEPSASDI